MVNVIFDFFGTLADSNPNLLCAPRGHLMSFGEDRWMVQDEPEHKWFEEYTTKHGGNAKELKDCFADMTESIQFFEGTKDLIAELAKDHELHLLSNTGKSLREYLNHHPDFTDSFSSITLSCEVGLRKPDQRIFRLIIDSNAPGTQDYIMIGDSKRDDIRPAQKIGMRTIHFKGRKQSIQELREKISKLL